MSAQSYLAEIMKLLEQLGTKAQDSILRAGEVVAATLEAGNRIWVTPTTYSLHEEATGRAGGFIAVHVMNDAAHVQPGDCVLVGSPVGTSVKPISSTLECQARGAYVIALTNREFENDAETLLEHPLQHRLHEIADLLVDIPGPLGDGVFDIPELRMRAIPHSGITGMTAMWMIFSEALFLMRGRGITPRLYECVNIAGARERNAIQISGYISSALGFLEPGEAEAVFATEAPGSRDFRATGREEHQAPPLNNEQ